MADRVTIRDVAAVAGVSIKTVSRVVNDEGGVSQETRDVVRAAASRLGYQPNLSARGLASARSFLLALIYDNPTPSYIVELQMGASEECRRNGRHLLVEPVGASGPGYGGAVQQLVASTRLSGAILAPPLCESEEVLEVLDRWNTPYVRVGAVTERPGAAVRSDDHAAAQRATDYLVDLGHRRIGFIAGPVAGPAAIRRRSGYEASLRAHGLSPQIAQGDFTFRSGMAGGEHLLSGPDRPSAIFAANDEMAFGVMIAAAKLKLDVPRQLSVVGFDDSPAARAVWPQLTTVRQPIWEMGAAAARLLIEDEPQPMAPVFEAELVVRSSASWAP